MSADVIIGAFGGHNEIQLPNNHIVLEIPEVDARYGHDRKPANSINENDKQLTKRKLVTLLNLSKDGALKQDSLRIHKEDCNVQLEKEVTSPISPLSPSSIYTFGGSETHRHLELKPRNTSTRQCKFEIGEEWEQFQTIQTTTSVSCPPSPLMGGQKTKDLIDEETGRTNPGYAASEPGVEIEQDLTDSAEKLKEPFPFHFLFTSNSGTPPKHYTIVPNPHNRINQRFHSTLQCPCFLFFFFLCCLPAVHFMQQSDRQFKKGNTKRASNYGKLATVFYTVGSVIGVTFLAIAIYFASDYVRQYV